MNEKSNIKKFPDQGSPEDQELIDRFDRTPAPETNDPDVLFEAENRPFIDPGEYDLEYLRHDQPVKMWDHWRQVLYFRVVSGDYRGIVLPRFYNLKENRNGKAVASPKSLYGREIKALFGAKRLDRFSIAKSFSGHVIVGEVSTVENDSRKEPQDCPYSKIKALLRIKS